MATHAARAPLASIAAVSVGVVGLLLAIGGLALFVAVMTTSQPGLQGVTALALLMVGAIDIRSSFGIRRRQPNAVLQSAVATLILLSYLGLALRDFGELFWINVLLLSFLGMATSRAE